MVEKMVFLLAALLEQQKVEKKDLMKVAKSVVKLVLR